MFTQETIFQTVQPITYVDAEKLSLGYIYTKDDSAEMRAFCEQGLFRSVLFALAEVGTVRFVGLVPYSFVDRELDDGRYQRLIEVYFQRVQEVE